MFKRMLIKFKRDDDPDVRINAFQFDKKIGIRAVRLTPPLRGNEETESQGVSYDEIIIFDGDIMTFPLNAF